MCSVLELVFVMARGQNHFFVELVAALRHELDELGVRSVVSTSGFPPAHRGLVYVLVPPHEYFVLRGGLQHADSRLLARSMFLCAEQPGTVHFLQNVQLAASAGAVLDISPWATAEYRRRGIRARHLQLGYSAQWDRFVDEPEQDIDALVLASTTPRRDRFLASFGPVLSRMRSRIVLSDNAAPNDGPSGNFVVGEEKMALMVRSRVLLNLHQGAHPYFEWLRVLEAIHCGCAVVTEHSAGHEPLRAGDHFLTGRPGNLCFLAQQAVEDDQLRRQLRRDAFQFIRAELPLRQSVEGLVSAAETVARRAPRRRTSEVRAPNQTAGATVASKPASPREEDQPDEHERMLMAIKDLRLDMFDLRREVVRAAITARDGSAPSVRRVWACPAYLGRPAPRVSVIVALYNQGHFVRRALDSAVAGTYQDIEIVVVDDGSVDDSLATVREWAVGRPDVPLLLLNHPVNRGLPYARNTGLDFSRGEFALILDADNDLLPNCLDRLVAALDADPGASFAYGILACFDQDGYVSLVSKFPWEPARLRQGNYIDALAVLRLDVLREMGGYTTDRRLYGWEDYDLYCRMAEAGRRAVFVPELVARYRVSAASMLSVTNISTTAAYMALQERCPNLMGDALPPTAHEDRLPVAPRLRRA